jgi:hypothetical protein
VVELLLIEGDQLPLIPSFDCAGKLNDPPEQISPTWVNVVEITGKIVIVMSIVSAHSPGSGVNVYVVVTVLSITGDQVPFIPLFDIVGKLGIAAPWQ